MELITCPGCGKGNREDREICWKCNLELSPSEQISETETMTNPHQGWADGTYAYRRNPNGLYSSMPAAHRSRKLMRRNPLIDPRIGEQLAQNIFSRNPDDLESEEGDLSMFNRNPRSWGARRNPQAPVWGNNLWGGQKAAWGNTLFRNRKLKRRNPAATWETPLFGKGAAWGKTLFRRHNPMDSVISADDDADTLPFGGELVKCACGRMLQRGEDCACSEDFETNPDELDLELDESPAYRHNPSVEMWDEDDSDADDSDEDLDRNPDVEMWDQDDSDDLDDVDDFNDADEELPLAPASRYRNPSALWNTNTFGRPAWGNTLFRRSKLRRRNAHRNPFKTLFNQGWGGPLYRGRRFYRRNG